MTRKTTLTIAGVIFVAAWAAIGALTMTSGQLVTWPDFVHANFGFPLTFAVHTLSTIAGPADSWSLDTGALTADIAFWFTGIVAFLVALVFYLQRLALPASRPT